MNELTIAGIEITTDAEGRFNLNALHKASGEGANKAPAQWLRTKQAQDFIQEIIDVQICTSPVSASKGGLDQGTFAHELIAVEYAGWINAGFRIRVNQTFIDYRTGKLKPAMAEILPIATQEQAAVAMLESRIKAAELFKIPEHIGQQEAVKSVHLMIGVDYAPLLRLAPAQNDILASEEMLEPTALAERLGVKDGAAMNLLLRDMGLQVKTGKQWTPTALGAPISAKHAWMKGASTGYNLKWRVLAIQEMLQKREAA